MLKRWWLSTATLYLLQGMQPPPIRNTNLPLFNKDKARNSLGTQQTQLREHSNQTVFGSILDDTEMIDH